MGTMKLWYHLLCGRILIELNHPWRFCIKLIWTVALLVLCVFIIVSLFSALRGYMHQQELNELFQQVNKTTAF